MPAAGDKRQARLLEVRRVLHEANIAYYVDAAPTLSDSEYDGLMQELLALEIEFPDMADPDSPSQRVGGTVLDGFTSHTHAVAMLSIDNTYEEGDLRDWYARVCRGLSPGDGMSPDADESPTLYCDPKIDGVAVSLRYEAGRLVQALTRGDGIRGDDISTQARTIRAIPLRLREGGACPVPSLLEIRGEIFMDNDEFCRVNEERSAERMELLANARNATAGALKSLDSTVAASRRMNFLAHGRGVVKGIQAETFSGLVEQVRSLGLPVSDHAQICSGIDAAIKVIHAFEEGRGDLGYGVDGIVVRVDRFAYQEALGATSRAPRWCIAFKYQAEQGSTRLHVIDWQIGKGGTLTPRAVMEPVHLAGTTVSHASLHNIEEIHRRDLRIGDTVIVEKAGEIIPHVVGVVLADRPRGARPVAPPRKCPSCGGDVRKVGPKIFCMNPACPAQWREKMCWFVGRGQMDIEGCGEKLVDQLLEAGLLRTYGDIFTLRREELLALDRQGETSADNLLQAIDDARARGLERVLAGLGIPQVGSAAARTLAGAYPDMQAIQAASRDEIAALPDFGDIMAELLVDWFASDAGRDAIAGLEQAGVLLQRMGDEGDTGGAPLPLAGKRIVLTGRFISWDRGGLAEALRSRGAVVTGSVSSRTDLLVAGDAPGSKLARAQELGIEICHEKDLAVLLDH